MLKNYIILAFRNLMKNKIYAAINTFGLAIGLTIFVFAIVANQYERNYDNWFKNADDIYSVRTEFTPTAGVGIDFAQGTYSAVTPLIPIRNPNLVAARSFGMSVLMRYEDNKFYQDVNFVDEAFLDIFNFDFVMGNAENALTDPSSVILTESAAERYFGSENPLGKTLEINQVESLTVSAVISNIPNNSHFQGSLVGGTALEIIASVHVYNRLAGETMEGNWGNLSSNFTNYVLLTNGATVSELQATLDEIFTQNMSEDTKATAASLFPAPLRDMNTYVWDASGIPVLDALLYLGGLILVVACLNYTNLATAQALGRMKEIGLRKSMGASKKQLLSQILTESTLTAMVSLLIALGALELIIPVVNDALGKEFSISIFLQPIMALIIIAIVCGVGLIAGGYPAYTVTRLKPAEILRGSFQKGRKGVFFRNTMLVIQFSISIFMIALVFIIYQQNQQLEREAEIFDKDQILIINRMNSGTISPMREALKREIEAIPGVEVVSLLRQAPFEQSQSRFDASKTGDFENDKTQIYRMQSDEDFMRMFDLTLLAGREFDDNIAGDRILRDEDGNRLQDEVNVMINDLAATRLGFNTPEEAIGQSFIFRVGDENTPITNRIIGVVPTVNYMGLFNELKPYMYDRDAIGYTVMTARLSGQNIAQTVEAIDDAWNNLFPDLPIERRFLDEDFDSVFVIFSSINAVLAAFASIAMILASIGLFGMAAYMAERKTKEIGIRKVMGAKVEQIIRQLVWQFSRPVFIALGFGLLLAAFGAQAYLGFFDNPISLSPILFVLITLGVLALSWATVGLHAVKVARANPIHALRYE